MRIALTIPEGATCHMSLTGVHVSHVCRLIFFERSGNQHNTYHKNVKFFTVPSSLMNGIDRGNSGLYDGVIAHVSANGICDEDKWRSSNRSQAMGMRIRFGAEGCLKLGGWVLGVDVHITKISQHNPSTVYRKHYILQSPVCLTW